MLYGSSDGGATWGRLVAIKASISNDGGEVLFFADRRHGWIAVMSGVHHNGGEIFATADGGRTWTRVYVGDLAGDLRFTDAYHGWLSTGWALYESKNGGKTWKTVRLPGAHISVGLPLRLGSKLILPAMARGANGLQLRLYSSDGAGGAWEVLFTQAATDASIVIVASSGDLNAWVATVDGSLGFRTEDGGRHWTRFSIPQGFDLVQLDFVSPNVGWMVALERPSFGYALFQTDDGGKTWMRVSPVLRSSR